MDQVPLNEFERQLEAARQSGAPAELRHVVLTDVRRELRTAHWDRRLARFAVLLLVVGIGANAALMLRGNPHAARSPAGGPTRESLVQVAVSVAEATDARTGRRFARQLAALAGRDLTGDEAIAIEAAVASHPVDDISPNGNEG